MIFSKKRKEKRSSNNNSSEANQNSSCLALALCDQQERESRANKPGSAHTTISSQATWVEIGVSECVRRTYIHTHIIVSVCEQHWLFARSVCCLWFCLWPPLADFWAIHTHAHRHTHTLNKFEHLARAGDALSTQLGANVTTVIRSHAQTCKSSSNNKNGNDKY